MFALSGGREGGGFPEPIGSRWAGTEVELKRRRSIDFPVAGQTVCIMS